MGASIWDIATKQLVTSFSNHGSRVWVTGGAFVDDSRVLTVGLDAIVRVWEPMTGTELAQFSLRPAGEANEVPELSLDAARATVVITRPGHVDAFHLPLK